MWFSFDAHITITQIETEGGGTPVAKSRHEFDPIIEMIEGKANKNLGNN